MKRILVLGSSHVGAIKKGFSMQSIPDNMKFDFIALPGKKFEFLKISNDKLQVPHRYLPFITRTFGLDELPRLDGYDYFLFCHGQSRLSFDLYSQTRKVPVLSKSVVKAIIAHVNLALFKQIVRSVEPSKVIFIGAPLISEESCKKQHLSRVPLISSETDMQDANCLANLIRQCCSESFESQGPSFLLPPAHVLTQHEFLTRKEFMRGGVRVDGRVREEAMDTDFAEDVAHGNTKYGIEISKLVINRLSCQ